MNVFLFGSTVIFAAVFISFHDVIIVSVYIYVNMFAQRAAR